MKAAIDNLTELGEMPPPTGPPLLLDDESIHRRGQVYVPNALKHSTLEVLELWEDFVGQEKLKRQLLVHIAYAQETGTRLPHVLLASGHSGVGKTTLSRMVAQTMEVNIIELVPPFSIYTLADAALQLLDGDVLFIDEIHALAQNGKKGAEILLKVLEDHTAYLPNGEVVELCDITVIGATTDRDLLPEPVLDRFKLKPFFEPYTANDMEVITLEMAARHGCLDLLTSDDFKMCGWLARVSGRTPRITEEMVIALRALTVAYGGVLPNIKQFLDFVDVQPDGCHRGHVDYLLALYTRFGRSSAGTGEMEYIAGEDTLQSILRETKQGLARTERFLLELGYIERTRRGRALTQAGIDRAGVLFEDPTPSASFYD